jgi:phospholipid/cholesterol/gamma-HCH transport system substrate-binding protein
MTATSTLTKALATLAAVSLLAGFAIVLFGGGRTMSVTALFPQSVSLYPQDEVRMLGVPIGTVDSVEPAADHVVVRMSYDADYSLPADASAAIVAPTLVGIRYVQLGPAYTGGPTLADGATIPMERTGVPLEWDEIRAELNELAVTLGPDNAQALPGSLARALDTTSANLGGNGTAVRDTIRDVSALLTTLSTGREDLFGTVKNLQTLVRTLRDSDQAVGRFNVQLAEVSGVLAENRQALGTALSTLEEATPLIEGFIRDNRARLTTNVEGLNGVAETLADNRQGLADVLLRAPSAISNFYNIIDERNGPVTAALGTTIFRDPGAFLCGAGAGLIPGGLDNPDATTFCEDSLGPLLQVLGMDNVPVGLTPPPITEDAGTELDRRPDGNLADLILPGGNR